MYDARSRGCGARARSHARLLTRNRACGNRSSVGSAGSKRREQPAGVIEVQMAQHDDVDVLVRDAARRERAQQHVLALENAVARAQLRTRRTRRCRSRTAPCGRRDPATSRQRHANSSRFSSSGGASAPRACAARCRTSRRRRGAGDCLQRTRAARGASSSAALAAPNCSSASRAYSGLAASNCCVRAARDDAAVIRSRRCGRLSARSRAGAR